MLTALAHRQNERLAIARSASASWHVLRAVGRSDQATIDALGHRGYPVFYPRILELRPVAKRHLSARQRHAGVEIRRPTPVPLFPRYLFVRLDLTSPGWRDALLEAGAQGLVCEGGLPVRVSDATLGRIKVIETQGAIVARTEKLRTVFAVGDNVLINSGPFRDHHGIMQTALDAPIDEVDAATRVRVALNILGGATLVELDLWQVDAL